MKKIIFLIFVFLIVQDIFSQTVNSVSPDDVASVNKEVLFTVTGSDLPSTLAFHIDDLDNITSEGGNSSVRYFKGTFNQFSGTKNGVVKDMTGGNELYTFDIEVVSEPTITLLQPNSGTFTAGDGTVMEIDWQSTNQSHWEMNILKDGQIIGKEQFGSNHPNANDTHFNWTIPSSTSYNGITYQLDGDDYKIKIAVWNTGDSNTATSAGDESSGFITFVPPVNSSPPNHITSSITPDQGESGSDFTFNMTWDDPDDDSIDAVEVRHKKSTSGSWTYISGNEISYVSGTNPPQYSVTKNISGSTGTYEFESRALDDNGAWSNWTFGANFELVENQNTPPNNPSFSNVPNPIYINESVTIQVVSGTDPDNDNTKIRYYATGSNYPTSLQYGETSFQNDGDLHFIPLTFSQLGNQTIYILTVDENDAVNNNGNWISQNITVEENSSGNSAPNSPQFISVPTEAEVGETITLTVRTGSDPDNDLTKISLYADGSNCTAGSPCESSLTNGNSNVTIPITFSQQGVQTIYAKTVDSQELASALITTQITINEGGNPNSLSIGNLVLTADSVVETNSNIFELTGNVSVNNLLHFTGTVTANKNDLSIAGDGVIYIDNIPNTSGNVNLYEGSFSFDVPNNSNEIIATGVEAANNLFEIAQMDIHISSIELLSDGIEVNGNIILPELFGNLATEINQIRITSSGGIDLIGQLTLDEVTLVGNNKISASLEFNTVEDTFTGQGTLDSPLFDIGASLGVVDGNINQIGVSYNGNAGIPLGTTGLLMTGVSGSLDNLSTPQPIEVALGMSLAPAGGGNIVELSNVSLTYAFGTSLEGYGTFKVMGQESANAGFAVSNGLFKVNAEINFEDVVNTYFEAALVQNQTGGIDVMSEFGADIQIPNGNGFPYNWIDAIPGIELPYQVAQFDNTLFNTKLTGKGEIGWFGIDFSYELSYENGQIERRFAKNFSLYNEIAIPSASSRGINAVFENSELKNNQNRFEGKGLIINPSRYQNVRNNNNEVPQNFILPSVVETLVVRLKPETSGTIPEFSLTTPNNELIDRSTVDNFENIEYTENTEINSGYYTIKDAESGNWDIAVTDNGQSNILDLYGTKNESGIIIESLQRSDDIVEVSWVDYNPDYDGQISLYYDNNGQGLDGTFLVSGISEDDEDDTFSFDISDFNPGTYYVYALMFDEEGIPVSSYSIQSFSIGGNLENPHNLQYTINSDDSITLNWEGEENLDYLLYRSENEPVDFSSLNIALGNEFTVTLHNLDLEPIYEFMIVASDDNDSLSNPSNTVQIDLAKSQTLNLHEGWNLVGFPLSLFDNSVASSLSSISSSLLQINTQTQVYNPSLPDFLNTLQFIEHTQGYYIRLSEDVDISFRGSEVNLEGVSFSLQEGWNLISYPSIEAKDVEEALTSISDFIIQVNNQTQVYNPSLPDFLNTLGQLTQGEGYWIKVSQNCTLTF